MASPVLIEEEKTPADCVSTVNHLHFRAFIRCFCPKQLTVFHTYIHVLMPVATMQGAVQQIRSSLTRSCLMCRPGEWDQRPSDDKTLALPLSNRPPDSCLNYCFCFFPRCNTFKTTSFYVYFPMRSRGRDHV